jgi:excinuclease UvrABC nuclease subunit
MGLRADKDQVKRRYIYFLLDDKNCVLYVGTAVNPKQRYKTHLNRSQTENALLYRYVRQNNIKLKLQIVCAITSTYANAEQLEIQYIEEHQNTVLNFYNNPNKERIKEIDEKLK